MRSPDGDSELSVPRIVDRVGQPDFGGPDRGSHRPEPGVSRRSHDDNSGLNETIHFRADGTLPAGEHLRIELVADAEVHAVDPQQLRIVV